jgi:hypothetical protein
VAASEGNLVVFGLDFDERNRLGLELEFDGSYAGVRGT